MTRLSAATLALAADAEVPRYDRTPPPAIVHLGVGAFSRAHLATYADDLLQAGWPATIRGVSLRSARAEEQLGPQDGLFTVTTRAPSAPSSTRVIGSIASVATGARRASEAIADPTTTLVTLTVTEKGVELDGPNSVPALLATALDARRARTAVPLAIASLDNLIDNGHVLQRNVLRAAESLGGGLAEWITETVPFPRSVVDRMVPATNAADREEIAGRVGLFDEAATLAEPHRSWVIESTDGLPPLERVGVEIVADIEPYQQRKLWLLNGPHSALAYAGLLSGHQTIAEAANDPTVDAFVRQLIREVLAVISFEDENAGAFATSALARFRNPTLGHRCDQVGADGSMKLRQRILPVMAQRHDQGLPSPRLALVVGTWLAIVTGSPVAGTTLPATEDPLATDLRRTMSESSLPTVLALALGDEHRHLRDEVAVAFDQVRRRGVAALEDLP